MEHFTPEIFSMIFSYIRLSFLKLISGYTESTENKTLTEDNKIYVLKAVLSNTCRFLTRELRVRAQNNEAKLRMILEENKQNLEMLIGHVLRSMFTLNYGERSRDIMLEMVYLIVGIFEDKMEVFGKIKCFFAEFLLQGRSFPHVDSKYEVMVDTVNFRYYNTANLLVFKKSFAGFIEDFISEFITGGTNRI